MPQRRDIPPVRNDNPLNRGDNSGRPNVGGSQGSTGRTGGQRTGMDDLLRRKDGSRSGSVRYGSNSNRFDRTKSAISIDRIPSTFNKRNMGGMVRRADEVRVGNLRIRFGYNHYDSRWCDDYFYYPHYVFDPYAYNDWVFSPWYYYPQLPPYFNSRRCYFPTSYIWTPFYGVRYTWRQPSREYWNRDYNELDYVVEDIVSAFTDGDRRAVERLVPQRGNVAIVTDGRFAYQMRPDDFYDTFLDAVENTRTINYRILDVQYRRDVASIFAQHDFEDAWGRRTSVYHYYRVEAEGRNWVIREFGTSYNRW